MSANTASHVLQLSDPARAQYAAAGVFGLSWIVCMLADIPVFPFGLLIPALFIATVTDLTTRKIPNWLTYPTTLMALIAGAIVSFRLASGDAGIPVVLTFPEAAAGFAATFGIMLISHILLGAGAGDVKLAGAIGACIGVYSGLNMLLWTHITAGLAMLGYLAWQIGPRWALQTIGSRLFPAHVLAPIENHSQTFRYPVPMALYFSVGTILSLLEVPLP
ncbi:MAG: prepilin peptidase [Planctomyces sp.]|nr:prepilin peptidase [Planctomyces sp.]